MCYVLSEDSVSFPDFLRDRKRPPVGERTNVGMVAIRFYGHDAAWGRVTPRRNSPAAFR